MRIITRHITRQILVASVVVVFALLGLFLFFDLVGQADDIGTRYSLTSAFIITGLTAPSRLYEVMPIAVLLGSIYAMSRLAVNSEFTILRVTGMGPLALVRALMVPGFIFLVLTYALGEFLVPMSETAMLDAKLKATNRAITASGRSTGVWARDQVFNKDRKLVLSRYVNVRTLTSGTGEGANGWTVYEFSADGELTRLIQAPSGTYKNNKWMLRNATVTTFPSLAKLGERDIPKQIVRRRVRQFSLNTSIAPRLLSVMVSDADKMSMMDLAPYLRHLRGNMEETTRHEIALWKKAFYPLSIFVMLALSLPFAYLSARSGGMSIKIFVGVMMGIVFYAMNNLFSYLGVMNSFPPMFACLVPSLAGLALAAAAIWRVEQR